MTYNKILLKYKIKYIFIIFNFIITLCNIIIIHITGTIEKTAYLIKVRERLKLILHFYTSGTSAEKY